MTSAERKLELLVSNFPSSLILITNWWLLSEQEKVLKSETGQLSGHK
jgi:hypothetical protein